MPGPAWEGMEGTAEHPGGKLRGSQGSLSTTWLDSQSLHFRELTELDEV